MNFCIMLLFDTGMRCNEMILMEPEDIKPDYILVKHGKGSKERVVPKSPALSKQLMKYRTLRDAYLKEYPSRHKNLFLSKNGKPLTDEAVARMHEACGKRGGSVALGTRQSAYLPPHLRPDAAEKRLGPVQCIPLDGARQYHDHAAVPAWHQG